METSHTKEEFIPICNDHMVANPTLGAEEALEDTEHKSDIHVPQPSCDKKSGKKEVIKVYGYMKKKVVNHLEENGCSSKSVDEVITASKFDKATILEYMNQRMEMSQMHVHEECNSLSFKNIEQWLEYFKKWGLPDLCIYEPALVINATANNEDLPNPEDLQGIDLKSAYKFLGNALLGLPQPPLNKKTAHFLANEFEFLIGEANTNYGDEATLDLNQKLLNLKSLRGLNGAETSSIDPLGLVDN